MRIYFSGNAQENCTPEEVLASKDDVAVMLTYAEINKGCNPHRETVFRLEKHAKQRRAGKRRDK